MSTSWQHTAYSHTAWSRGGDTEHYSTRKGQLEAPRLESSWSLPYASLPLANVNLYPLPVINYEYNFQ